MWHKIPFNLIPSVLKSEKNWAIEEIKKKTSVPPLFAHIFHFTTIFGGTDFFFEILSIVQFFSDFEMNGTKLFRRATPLYPDTKMIWYLPHWGGGAPQLTYQQFFRGKLKSSGASPPKVVYIKLFYYLNIRGSLFQTIWCQSF